MTNSYQVIVNGKRVDGYETSSAKRAKAFVESRFPAEYERRDYAIVSPPVGASIRWVNA